METPLRSNRNVILINIDIHSFPGKSFRNSIMTSPIIRNHEPIGSVMQSKKNKPAGTKTQCTRCGICCEKGGPSFHLQDRHLIEKGHIHTRHLYTIRKGERVHDNVQGQLTCMDFDIIKIKGKQSSWECVFFQKKDKSCQIYDHRPLECRVLKCWDTREIEAVYEKDRLTRQDILAGIEGLWELIADHEKQCAHDTIKHAIQDLDGPYAKQAQELIAGAVRYDNAIRQLVLDNGHVEPDMVDFLFGRPLTVTLKSAGYSIQKGGDVHHVCRTSKSKGDK
jgi:Fe-S-cluster containining protein